MLPGEREVVINRLLRKLSGVYNVSIPTATKARKAMATTATSRCTEREIRTLSDQLSHTCTMQMHRRYYEQKRAKE